MKKVEIIKPIPLAPELGGDADGWKRSGQVDLPNEDANKYEAMGWVDIVSCDGKAVVWPACCGGVDHTH